MGGVGSSRHARYSSFTTSPCDCCCSLLLLPLLTFPSHPLLPPPTLQTCDKATNGGAKRRDRADACSGTAAPLACSPLPPSLPPFHPPTRPGRPHPPPLPSFLLSRALPIPSPAPLMPPFPPSLPSPPHAPRPRPRPLSLPPHLVHQPRKEGGSEEGVREGGREGGRARWASSDYWRRGLPGWRRCTERPKAGLTRH